MAEMIQLPDGSVSAVLCLQDFMELTGKWMGSEAIGWLEGYLEDIRLDDRDVAELEKELEKQKDHHRKVMERLRYDAEEIVDLIREKEIDRVALSAAAGRIGTITWRESNV